MVSFHLLCIVSRHWVPGTLKNEAAYSDCTWQPRLLSPLLCQLLEGRCKEIRLHSDDSILPPHPLPMYSTWYLSPTKVQGYWEIHLTTKPLPRFLCHPHPRKWCLLYTMSLQDRMCSPNPQTRKATWLFLCTALADIYVDYKLTTCFPLSKFPRSRKHAQMPPGGSQ